MNEPTNPYHGDAALRESEYYRVRDGELQPWPDVRATDGEATGGEATAGGVGAVGGFAAAAHRAFREKIAAPGFSCVAAKAALNTEVYRFGCYRRLGDGETTAGLARDLLRFRREQDEIDSDFTTFVAVFASPRLDDERAFEDALWAQLRLLHRRDRRHFDYADEVDADPESPHFGFSFAERAYFVVGLNPHSDREARRFPFPALVFNAHRQFQELRRQGRWERLKEVIRQRELELQGSLNPNLADHGEASEARQYAGRPVGEAWRPPFPRRAEELDD